MTIPFWLVPLLLGGGIATKEISSKLAADRIQRRNVQNFSLMKALSQGKEMDQTKKSLEVTGQMPATKAPAAPTTKAPKAPEAKEARLELEEEPEIVKQAKYAGHEPTPRMLKEFEFNLAKGEMDVTYKENAAYFKREQEKAFAADMQRYTEENIAQGMRPGPAGRDAHIKSTIANGLHGNYAEWKQVYPELTPAKKYDTFRSSMISRLADGIDFERAWQLEKRFFPDATLEDRTKIANEIYLLHQAMYLDEATELKVEEGLTGTALEVEAGLEAARMAADQGLAAYLSPAERERISKQVTRVEDLPQSAAKGKLMVAYGKDAIVTPGQVAEVDAALAAASVEKIRIESLTRKRAEAGAQAEQVVPLIDGLEQMALALNKEVDLAPRLWEGAKMWLYGKAQKGPYEIKVGDEMVDVGVLVADYTFAAQSFLGTLARVFGGERGVLTQQDIERIAKAIPKLGGSKGLTQRQMKRLRTQMEKIMARAKIAAADPTYRNPDFVPNTEADIRKLKRIVGQEQIIHGSSSKIKGYSKRYGAKK